MNIIWCLESLLSSCYDIMAIRLLSFFIIIVLFVSNSEQWCKNTAGFTTCGGETFQIGHPLKIVDYRTFLSFEKGTISTVPSKTFKLLPNLTVLQLSHNNIKQLENNSFEGLEKLQQLNLYNNKIEILPEEIFSHCTKLQQLDLGLNLLSIIEERTFENLLELKEINLSFNKFKTVPNALNRLKSLNILKLNNNFLTEINSNTFDSLVNLEILNLNDNSLQRISENAFKGFGKLKELRLDNNYLKALPVNSMIENMPSLNTIVISLNTFDCKSLEGIKSVFKINRISVKSKFAVPRKHISGPTCENLNRQ